MRLLSPNRASIQPAEVHSICRQSLDQWHSPSSSQLYWHRPDIPAHLGSVLQMVCDTECPITANETSLQSCIILITQGDIACSPALYEELEAKTPFLPFNFDVICLVAHLKGYDCRWSTLFASVPFFAVPGNRGTFLKIICPCIRALCYRAFSALVDDAACKMSCLILRFFLKWESCLHFLIYLLFDRS